MLELRSHCECCGVDLAPSSDARICSFECTFCAGCAADRLEGCCPNCGGDLQPRPRRPDALLEKYPPSMRRRPLACGAADGERPG
jgi:uncharacterized protein